MSATSKPKLYNPRHPERTLLYQTVAEHYETWLELASAGQFDGQGDHHTPKPFVRKAFAKYLECGIFAHGFARARCGDCGHDYFVAFSCKGRGVCPSCTSPSAWMEKTGSAFGWPFFLPCVSVGLRSSQTPCTVLFSSSMKRSGMVFKSSAVIAFASSNCFLASASFSRRFWRSFSYSSNVFLCLACASASAFSACRCASSLSFCRRASPSAVRAGFPARRSSPGGALALLPLSAGN